jgi:outer membrane receptor for ferrienterochelin and colicin
MLMAVFVINAKPEDVLVISFVGYNSKQFTVGSVIFFKISLTLLVNDLDEVIVTDTLQQKIKEITGSVAVVKTKDLVAVPAAQVEQMLQGRVAGLNVVSSGQPGGGSDVRFTALATLVRLHRFI